MEYYIATHEDLGKLMERVKDLIKDGWVPQGGVSFCLNRGMRLSGQAMVRNTS